MKPGVIQRCIVARLRIQAPPARAVMPVMGVVPIQAPTGVLSFGGLTFGGTGPEAAT